MEYTELHTTGGFAVTEENPLPVTVIGGAGGGLTDAQLRASPVEVTMAVGGGGLTDSELRATPVPVSGTVSVNLGLTDAQLRAAPVDVDGTVSVDNFPLTQAVTGPVTDSQLRATPVPVSGTVTVNTGLTDAQLRTTPVPVSGTVSVNVGLTDTQLRATPVPVSGTVTVNTGLTDAQLRATPVPVSGTVTATGPMTDAQARAAPLPVYVKDSGRVRVAIKFHSTSSVAETLLSMVKQTAGVDAGGATSIGVTSGKRLRLTGMSYSCKAGAAAAAFATLNLRSRPDGATIISSPSFFRMEFGLTAATSGSAVGAVIALPDGLEFSGAETIGATISCQATTNIHSLTLHGYEYTP